MNIQEIWNRIVAMFRDPTERLLLIAIMLIPMILIFFLKRNAFKAIFRKKKAYVRRRYSSYRAKRRSKRR